VLDGGLNTAWGGGNSAYCGSPSCEWLKVDISNFAYRGLGALTKISKIKSWG